MQITMRKHKEARDEMRGQVRKRMCIINLVPGIIFQSEDSIPRLTLNRRKMKEASISVPIKNPIGPRFHKSQVLF